MRAAVKDADLTEGRKRRRVRIERWNDQNHEAAAHLIAAAYENHIDSRINDQYRSVMGARRFLFNIVQFPGCGVFFRPASFTAFAGHRPAVRHLAREPGGARERTHHADLCFAGNAWHGLGTRVAAAIAGNFQGGGMSFSQPYGDRGES